MNQALEGVIGLEAYSTRNSIYHCTHASTDSADLKNDLMQLCARPWLDIMFSDGFPDLLSLFVWLYKVCQV
jgi:hypothetical protein